MKTYSSLSIDVIRFEAQDVITSSTALDTNCVCTRTDGALGYRHYNDNGVACTADVHKHTSHDYCEFLP